ncbi:hypothetical protein BC830DRAFT_1087238 [Chytriomyces sp. MP71]|nr:hypothetical protein BC830DRAFT_1087238 [Chytriomyces sp. MP71]
MTAFPIEPCTHTLCRACAHDAILAQVRARAFPLACPVCKALASAARFCDPPRAAPALLREEVVGKSGGWVRRWEGGGREEEGEEDEGGDEGDAYVAEISLNLASTVLTLEEMNGLERVSLLAVIDSNPHFQRCPNARCEAVYYNDNGAVASQRCAACNTVCCWRCKTDSAHDGFSCAQYQEVSARHGGDREQMRFEETAATERWKRCPGCGIATAKNEGCNKMSCEICKTYWCFHCGRQLAKRRPYAHYTSRFSPCHNKLFHD